MKRVQVIAIILTTGVLGGVGLAMYSWVREQRTMGDSILAPLFRERRPPSTNPYTPPRVPSPPPRPSTRPAGPLFLATLATQPIPVLSPEQWAAAYPPFPGAARPQVGFSAVTLPLRFGAVAGGDPAEAAAFAFLLSEDLNWSPRHYNTPNAFSVFRRSPEVAKRLSQVDDEAAIADTIREWQATHAVGGVLVRGPQGYVATLQIFGSDGKPVHVKEFEKPRPYFELLGDVSAETMRFFGDAPSESLVTHLRRERCKHPESLLELGRVAFLEDASPKEMKALERIVEADPDFAEVRRWRAVRQFWDDHDTAEFQ